MNLYPWQISALNALRMNSYSGVVVAVTGTGKTQVGIEAIKELNVPSLIVVPTIQLMFQWRDELVSQGFNADDIGVYFGEKKEIKRFTIGVINSICSEVHLEKKFDLLIADETHRYAAQKFSQLLLNSRFKYAVGLTATLERQDQNHTLITERIGEVVYSYQTDNAVKDGMLNEFSIINYGIDLPEKERSYLERLNLDIKGRMSKFGGDFSKVIYAIKQGNRQAAYILKLVNLRKQFLNNSTPKVDFAVRIIKKLKSEGKHKIIVFGEYIETADALYTALKAEDIECSVYYSSSKASKFKHSAKRKKEIVEIFREMDEGILITVKALDEGLNVKDCDVGILLGYNKTDRQAIQRMGRILRKAEGKHPRMYNLYYKNTIDAINAKNFADNFSESGNIIWR